MCLYYFLIKRMKLSGQPDTRNKIFKIQYNLIFVIKRAVNKYHLHFLITTSISFHLNYKHT